MLWYYIQIINLPKEMLPCNSLFLFHIEAVVQKCSVKKVFLKLLQNSQENTCVRVSFLIKHIKKDFL